MYKKSVPFSKFESGLLPRTVCPRRLSFSQFGILLSTLNCEKENLLGQTVLVKRPLSNLEKGTLFFVHPLFVQSVSHVTCDMSNAYANPWDMVNNFCFDVYSQNIKSEYLWLCRMWQATCLMSNAFVDPWDMLNFFCFHLYAQMLLFIGENVNDFFLTSTPSPVTNPIIELVPS